MPHEHEYDPTLQSPSERRNLLSQGILRLRRLFVQVANITTLRTDTITERTPDAGVTVDTAQIKDNGIVLVEAADHPIAPVATKGQGWVKTATPNEFWFTDDEGNDVKVGANGLDAHAKYTDAEALAAAKAGAGIADDDLMQVDDADAADDDYAKFTVNGLEGRSFAEVRSDINVADGADVTGSNAPQAHTASHKNSGSDEVATATPGANAIIKADADGKIGAGWLDDGDISHDAIADVSADDHHAQAHAPESHTDTGITGAELETLSDTSDADSLHGHSNHGVSHVTDDHAESHDYDTHSGGVPFAELEYDDATSDPLQDADSAADGTEDSAARKDHVHIKHHADAHTVASHSDTTGTGGELNELTDGSETTLHSHAGGDGERILGFLISDPGGDALTTGNTKAMARIPSSMNGYELLEANACVTTVSSSGPVTIQVAKSSRTNATTRTASVNMLSTPITVDVSEFDSLDAATEVVQTDGKEDVVTGDQIRIDIDAAGTGVKGLFVELIFGP